MLPPISREDFNDWVDILTTVFEDHDPKELDTLIVTVKTRLALSASGEGGDPISDLTAREPVLLSA